MVMLPCSQVGPVQLSKHTQSYDPSVLVHVALFLHTPVRHSLISTDQNNNTIEKLYCRTQVMLENN